MSETQQQVWPTSQSGKAAIKHLPHFRPIRFARPPDRLRQMLG